MYCPEISILFTQCRIALESGIMPKEGSLEQQDELFTEVFYSFVDRWKQRQYALIWKDVSDFTGKVLEAIGKMFGGKK